MCCLLLFLVFIALFFVSGFYLALRVRFSEFLESLPKSADIAFRALLAAGLGAVIVAALNYFLRYLGISFSALALKAPGSSDYLSAAATLIGAAISLIPIFWLIKQLNLQKQQNNTNMLGQALSLIAEANFVQAANSGRTIDKRRVELRNISYKRGIILRGAVPLLRDVACQDNGKYAWVAVKSLADIADSGEAWLEANIINAFEVIGIYIEGQSFSDKAEVRDIIKKFLNSDNRQAKGRADEAKKMGI